MQTQLKFQTLIELFNQSLGEIESLDKVCLEIAGVDCNRKLTFGQLKAGAQAFAVWLIRVGGVQPQDKVAILGKNRTDWDIAFWGAVLAGAVPVLIDPERPVEAVMEHIIHTESRLLVIAEDYQDANCRQELRAFASGRAVVLIEMDAVNKIASGDPQADKVLTEICGKIRPDDTAVILCTSGTTGDPREVELTHTNIIANVQGSLQRVRITGRDRLGHILPPHHSFGLTVGKLLPLTVGATNIYTNKYRRLPEFIREKQVTIFVAVPALFTVLAKNIEIHLAEQKKDKKLIQFLDCYIPRLVGKRIKKKLGWIKLRFFLSGSAPVPQWVLNVLWSRGLLLYEGYGTTENSPVYGFNDSPRKLGSVGKPINTLLVKIVNDRNEILPPFEKGEICLGGPCIMKGYHKNPQATKQAIETDTDDIRWLHTGDLGYLDKDGHLYITGRKKYIIVLPEGKNVNPERIELALSQAQYVKEILVVPGVHKDSAGIEKETVKAIVHPAWDIIEADTKLSSSDLVKQPQILKSLIWQSINECQRKSRYLSGFEKVSSQHLEIKIDEFQKTSTGKIKRQAYIKV